MEWTRPEARLWSSAFLPFCFSLGTMATALLAWLSPTWTKLHLSMALPQLVCLPLFLWVLHLSVTSWLNVEKLTVLFFLVPSQSLPGGCC